MRQVVETLCRGRGCWGANNDSRARAAGARTPGVMTIQSHCRRGRDNVAHICPACWRAAERLTNGSSVKCADGHVSRIRCGHSNCTCAAAPAQALSASA